MRPLVIAEQGFRKLDAPDKLKLAYLDIDLLEGVEANREEVLAVA